ncbi:MAG: DinB family protein [Bryobacteraceae bacterium]
MSAVPAWFERTFEFSFPVEMYPNVCVRLLGTPARLEELVSGVSRDILTAKPDSKWSMQEHVGHLADMEPLWLRRLQDFIAGRDTLTVADLSNRRTHEANHNVHELKNILDGFRSSRFELLEHLKRLEPAQFAQTLVHPRLQQPMRLVDHLYFVAEHDDHHLATMWKLIEFSRKSSAHNSVSSM